MRLPQTPWMFDEAAIVCTSAYSQTQFWLEEAMNTPGLWLLLGEPGVGKTFGALSYAVRNNIPYILPPPDDPSVKKFLRYIAKHIISEVEVTTDAFIALCEWCEHNTISRLIIDEAVRLNRSCLEALRDLNDRYPSTFLFVGTETLKRKIAYYDTIVHRIAGVFRVPNFDEHDVMKMFPDLETDAVHAMYERTRGNYRHLMQIVRRIENLPSESVTTTLINNIADRYILNGGSK